MGSYIVLTQVVWIYIKFTAVHIMITSMICSFHVLTVILSMEASYWNYRENPWKIPWITGPYEIPRHQVLTFDIYKLNSIKTSDDLFHMDTGIHWWHIKTTLYYPWYPHLKPIFYTFLKILMKTNERSFIVTAPGPVWASWVTMCSLRKSN